MLAPFMSMDQGMAPPTDNQFGGSTPIVMEDAAGGMQMMDLGMPHVTWAAFLLALILMKFMSESDFLSLDVSEVKVSFWNTVNIGLQASVFIMMLKVGSAAALGRGLLIPGLADFAGAL